MAIDRCAYDDLTANKVRMTGVFPGAQFPRFVLAGQPVPVVARDDAVGAGGARGAEGDAEGVGGGGGGADFPDFLD